MNDALNAWHAYVKSRDSARLLRLLHSDVVFESPVLHTPQLGSEIAFRYLDSAVSILTRPGFHYTNEWQGTKSAVLEFETEIEGIKINGVDIMSFCSEGTQIIKFKVMVRPLKAIQLLRRLMFERMSNG